MNALVDCYHCGESVPKGADFPVVIKGKARPMCCPGCQAVATAIASGGLENFYQYRSALSLKPDNEAEQAFAVYDLAEVSADYVKRLAPQTPSEPERHSVRLNVSGITCTACAWLIEHHLSGKRGIKEILINVSAHRATVVWEPEHCKLSDILRSFAEIGYQASPIGDQSASNFRQRENRSYLLKLGIAGLGMMQAGMLAIGLYAGAFEGISREMEGLLRGVSLLFATPVVFYSGASFLGNAWRNLRRISASNLRFSMDVPVALALLLAYLSSAWATLTGQGEIYFDAVTMFVFFLLVGRYLEMRVRHRNEILGEGLTSELPLVATKVVDGASQQVPVKLLQRGDNIRVSAGAILPCDGSVVEGKSEVSEALLTGEQRPILKQAGSEVSAGSVNGENPLTVAVTAVGQQTRLSAILNLVERAQSEKPKQTALADQLSGYFVLGVLLIASVTALWWWQHAPQQALWVVVAVLVVACPCALSLATPAALAVASAAMRKQGFLVTRGHVIEALANVDQVVFDKTGTLTEGNMSIVSVMPLGSLDKHALLTLAAALEADSKHPIARAFKGVEVEVQATDVGQHLASGITGKIAGQPYAIGSAEFVAEQFGFDPPQPPDFGQACLLLASDQQLLGWILLRDQLRPGAAGVIANLSEHMTVRLLSGDRREVVESVAGTLQINAWQAAVTPQQKLDQIRTLQKSGHVVLMVGDGINDIPVLSGADVSVAIGEATDLTKIHADSILLNGDLSALLKAFPIARRTRRIIRQNLSWAVLYNLIAVGFAVVGWIAPWAAAIGMSISSLLVVLNAMRLNKQASSSSTSRSNHQALLLGH